MVTNILFSCSSDGKNFFPGKMSKQDWITHASSNGFFFARISLIVCYSWWWPHVGDVTTTCAELVADDAYCIAIAQGRRCLKEGVPAQLGLCSQWPNFAYVHVFSSTVFRRDCDIQTTKTYFCAEKSRFCGDRCAPSSRFQHKCVYSPPSPSCKSRSDCGVCAIIPCLLTRFACVALQQLPSVLYQIDRDASSKICFSSVYFWNNLLHVSL